MSSLMSWKSSTELQLTVLEGWQSDMHASPLLSQSRFDKFVSEQFTPVEHKAQQPVSRSAFDAFVSTRFIPVQKSVRNSLSAESFAEYVSRMERAGFKARRCEWTCK